MKSLTPAFALLREMPGLEKPNIFFTRHMCNEGELLKEAEETLKAFKLSAYQADTTQNAQLTRKVEVGGHPIYFDFSKQLLSKKALDLLIQNYGPLLAEKIQTLRDQVEPMNPTENRMVSHHVLRAINPSKSPLALEVGQVMMRIQEFSQGVRDGSILSVTGQPFEDVVVIGIGGSYLGTKFLDRALRVSQAGKPIYFISNVDPTDYAQVIRQINPATTLVILISKTFTTAETLTNASKVREFLVAQLKSQGYEESSIVRAHFVGVSSNVNLAQEFGLDASRVFPIWDSIGGRFSVTSAVGVLPLSLAFGYPLVQQVLAGAGHMDNQFFEEKDLRQNMVVLMGLISFWNFSFLKLGSQCIVPYSQGLEFFVPHIQQVQMESNGKGVELDGTPVRGPTSPVVWGEPGTNAQHSFFQMLHQSPTVTPVDFIGFARNDEHPQEHRKLFANLVAQVEALAYGSPETTGHQGFPGNRPSTSLIFQKCAPFELGALLSVYENKIAVEGFLLNINSFDQFGVQLGKEKAKVALEALEADGESNNFLIKAYQTENDTTT